jgi:hypothetical protein
MDRPCKQLDDGEVEALITSIKRLRPRQNRAGEEVGKAIHYFQTNKERMRYAQSRQQGLFVGSGVVGAGCKAVVALRLKQSGMHWTVQSTTPTPSSPCAYCSTYEFVAHLHRDRLLSRRPVKGLQFASRPPLVRALLG